MLQRVKTLCLLLLLLGFIQTVFALTPELASRMQAISSAEQQLAIEKQRQQLLYDRLAWLRQETNIPQHVDKSVLVQADIDLAKVQTDQQDLLLTIFATQQDVRLSETSVQNLVEQVQDTSFNAGTTRNPVLDKLREQLDYQKALFDIQQQRLKLLRDSQKVVAQIIILQKNRKETLLSYFHASQKELRDRRLQNIELQLQREQQLWLTRSLQLNQQLTQISDRTNPLFRHLEVLIFEANERSYLCNLRLELASLGNQIADLGDKDFIVEDLSSARQIIAMSIQQLKDTKRLLNNKLTLLKQQQDLSMESKVKGIITVDDLQGDLVIFNDLQHNYLSQMQNIDGLEKQAYSYQEHIAQMAKQALATRQGLPGWDKKEWLSLGTRLLEIPLLSVQAVRGLLHELIATAQHMPLWQLNLLACLEAMWLGCWLWLRRYLRRSTMRLREKDRWISANIFAVIFELLRRNLGSLVMIGAIATVLIITTVSSKALSVFLSFALIIFSIKLVIGLARLSLLETVNHETGLDVKIYNRLKWGLLLGGLLTGLMVLAQQLPVDYQVSDFFNRLFMLFLLIISFLLLKGWRLIPRVLKPYFQGKRLYLKHAVSLLFLLFPLILFSTAVIGLIGYVDLAWIISRYEGIFAVVLITYLLARGVLNDLVHLMSVLCIQRLKNGWLWSEAFLKPLDHILRVLLCLLAAVGFFWLCGLDSYLPVINKINTFLNIQLFTFASSIFTPWVLIEIFIMALVIIWIARWTPEFAYRWFFAKTKDIGVRNSLSVFTQYSTVFLALFVALRIIGIDISVLKFIFGGLAIGIGFGLRDLANNFVSGVLLLIERPLRKGDMVTIGSHEGEVTHIGMRSVTIKTWDNTEVLVPNSETFNKPFTNWTHQDSIIRTVVKVKIKWHDEPKRVQDIILQVLKDTPAVVSFPEPEVFLKEIEESLLEFEVRYFINLQFNNSRPEIRSKVLFTIWERFKDQGIEPPHPQYDVCVKSDSSGNR